MKLDLKHIRAFGKEGTVGGFPHVAEEILFLSGQEEV